jgi:hypothetical protein
MIAAELSFRVARVAASPNEAAPAAEEAADPAKADPDLDDMVTTILERPLFTAGRRPPAAPAVAAPVVEEKTAPEIRGRLAGVMIGPDTREALFERDGEKPQAVRLGELIDGWTLAVIEADRVVLRSSFGEKTLEPAMAQRAQPPRVPVVRPRPAVNRVAPAPVPAAAARPGVPGMPPNPRAVQPGVARPGPQIQRPGAPPAAAPNNAPPGMRR